METDARIVVALLASLVVAAGAGAPAATSPQPSPVCPVCGDTYPGMWEDSEWTGPDDRTLTVRAHGNETATWVADLRWDDPGDAPAPDEADAVEAMARRATDESLYLQEYEGVAVEVSEGRTRIAWQTPGAVTERFGHGVFRPFHGEGVEQRLYVNVDELVVRAPAGQVVTNDPAVGAVTGDGGAVRVDGPERNVGDFYVVFGDERDAASAVATEAAVGSLVWPVAGENLLWLLLFPTVAFAVGLAGLYAAGRRWGADPDRAGRYAAAGLGAGGLVVLGSVVGPLPFGSLFSLPGILLALAALAAFGYAAAAGDRRLLAATAAAVPVIGLAPYVADAWPAVQVHGLYLITSIAYTGLAVAIVVFGAPWFLYGMALGQRQGAAP
jgi:hypothetical protein